MNDYFSGSRQISWYLFNVLSVILSIALSLSLDPTKIVNPPQDMQIVSGTTAQLMCQAEHDESLKSTFEVVWRKDGEEIPLSSKENSRYDCSLISVYISFQVFLCLQLWLCSVALPTC